MGWGPPQDTSRGCRSQVLWLKVVNARSILATGAAVCFLKTSCMRRPMRPQRPPVCGVSSWFPKDSVASTMCTNIHQWCTAHSATPPSFPTLISSFYSTPGFLLPFALWNFLFINQQGFCFYRFIFVMTEEPLWGRVSVLGRHLLGDANICTHTSASSALHWMDDWIIYFFTMAGSEYNRIHWGPVSRTLGEDRVNKSIGKATSIAQYNSTLNGTNWED